MKSGSKDGNVDITISTTPQVAALLKDLAKDGEKPAGAALRLIEAKLTELQDRGEIPPYKRTR